MSSNISKDNCISIYDFYMDILIKKYPELTNINSSTSLNLFKNHLLKLSQYYHINNKSNVNTIDEIYIFRTLKVKPNTNNYFFNYFIKNHFFIMEYIDKFNLNIEKDITDLDIKDYIYSNLLNCLKDNSITKVPSNKNKSDYMIIKDTCVKERLTYYNYLVANEIHPNHAKKYINKKYIEVIFNSNRLPEIEYVPGISKHPKSEYLSSNRNLKDVLEINSQYNEKI